MMLELGFGTPSEPRLCPTCWHVSLHTLTMYSMDSDGVSRMGSATVCPLCYQEEEANAERL